MLGSQVPAPSVAIWKSRNRFCPAVLVATPSTSATCPPSGLDAEMVRAELVPCESLTDSCPICVHCESPPCTSPCLDQPDVTLLFLGRTTMTGDRLWPACFNPFHSPKSKSHPCL